MQTFILSSKSLILFCNAIEIFTQYAMSRSQVIYLSLKYHHWRYLQLYYCIHSNFSASIMFRASKYFFSHKILQECFLTTLYVHSRNLKKKIKIVYLMLVHVLFSKYSFTWIHVSGGNFVLVLFRLIPSCQQIPNDF